MKTPTRYHVHQYDAPPKEQVVSKHTELGGEMVRTGAIGRSGGICCRLGSAGGFLTCTRK